MSSPARSPAILACLALAACAQPAEVQRSPAYERPLAQRGLDYAAAHGPVLTVITGDPFAQPPTARDELVLAAARRSLGGTGVELTTSRAAAARDAFRLVVVLNPEPAATAQAVCRQPEEVATAPAAEAVRVQAVFCEGAQALGEAEGKAGVASADDAAYTRLVRETVAALFPDLHRARVDRYYQDRWPLPVHLGLGLGIRI